MKFRLLAALIAPLWLANCATVVEGTDQSVQVSTDPSGANCTLKRAGGGISQVNPTPGVVVVSKSKDPIEVICVKQGYLGSTGYLQSGFQGMTFGNLLLGGFIGVAIDAGSGAMHQYPANIIVSLPPESFPSIQDRDAYYMTRTAAVRSEAEEAKAVIAKNCAADSGEDKGCKSALAKVDQERDARLDELERLRADAKIVAVS